MNENGQSGNIVVIDQKKQQQQQTRHYYMKHVYNNKECFDNLIKKKGKSNVNVNENTNKKQANKGNYKMNNINNNQLK